LIKLVFEFGGHRTPSTNYIEDLDKFTLTLRRKDESGQLTSNFSNTLTFIEQDYEYIKAILFDSETAYTNEIKVIIQEDCCDNEWEFLLKSESIELDCQGCSLTGTLTEFSVESRIWNCLNSTLIWENGFGKSKEHPRFVYCNDVKPEFVHFILLFLGFIVFAIATVIGIIIKIIGFITNFLDPLALAFKTIVSWIPKVVMNEEAKQTIYDACDAIINLDKTIISGVDELLDGLKDNMLGCGHTHPAPYIRDYLSNVCKICEPSGLKGWQSTIFSPNHYDADYWNACLLAPAMTKGTKFNDKSTFWIDQDKPILNAIQLLDLLKPVFNADYKIVNNVLLFERRDYFRNTQQSIDMNLYAEKITKCSRKWNGTEKPAYLNFQYTQEAIDFTGDHHKERFNEIVDWNDPMSNLQSGEKKVMLNNISFVRQRGDNENEEKEFDALTTIGNTIGKIAFPELLGIYKDAMLMNNGRTINYKILLLDKINEAEKYAYIKNNYGTKYFQDVSGEGFIVENATNYPLWCKEKLQKNLYDRFWSIDNPRNSTFKNQTIILEMEFDCDLLELIQQDRMILYEGIKGEITEAVLDFKNKNLRLTFEI